MAPLVPSQGVTVPTDVLAHMYSNALPGRSISSVVMSLHVLVSKELMTMLGCTTFLMSSHKCSVPIECHMHCNLRCAGVGGKRRAPVRNAEWRMVERPMVVHS